MSAVFPPTPELPEPGYFSSPPHQYEFYGENKIMSLFQTYQRLNPSAARQLPAVIPPKSSIPIPQRCRISDKVFLYKTLGFEFNDSGDKAPLMKRRGSILYRAPSDSRSFLEGILLQKRHFSPLMCKSLMWMSMPFNNLPRVSMYVVDTREDAFKVMKLEPQQVATSLCDKKEGEVSLKLWSCYRWLAFKTTCPEFLENALTYLKGKCVIPSIVTVDVLGDKVIDLHANSCVPDLDFDRTKYVEVSHQFDETRMFYHQSVDSIFLKD